MDKEKILEFFTTKTEYDLISSILNCRNKVDFFKTIKIAQSFG